MTFETTSIYPSQTRVDIMHAAAPLYCVVMCCPSHFEFVEAVMERNELVDLYLQIGKVLFPGDPDSKELSAKIDLLTQKIDNQLELFANGKS